jgi:hypothetical protein
VDGPWRADHRGGRWQRTCEAGGGAPRIYLAAHRGGEWQRVAAYLGGEWWHREDLHGSAPEGGRAAHQSQQQRTRLVTRGRVGRRLWERENPWKRGGVAYWVIGFRVLSPRASNVRPGNAVENAKRLDGLLRFWAKTQQKSETKQGLKESMKAKRNESYRSIATNF